jgi:hypothetical protein
MPIYEECKADESCAPLIGCAMGCWAEDDPESCFSVSCTCGPSEIAADMLGCVIEECSMCTTLTC